MKKNPSTIKDALAAGYRLNCTSIEQETMSENRIRQTGEWKLYADDGQKLAVPFKADIHFGSPRASD